MSETKNIGPGAPKPAALEIRAKLDENISKSDITSRQGGAGKTLSYLETWYVIDRMNQVLGQGNWGYQTAKLDKVFEGQDGQGRFTTSYIATVSLFATIDGKTVVFSDVGYGDGTDKMSAGKAHELATKEAVSDAVKRCAKNLGRSMGLALYDKTQEFIGKGKDEDTDKPDPGPKTITKINENTPLATTKNQVSKVARPVKELITAAFTVLEAQQKITADEFKTKYLGGKGIGKVDVGVLEAAYKAVTKDFPQLSGGK